MGGRLLLAGMRPDWASEGGGAPVSIMRLWSVILCGWGTRVVLEGRGLGELGRRGGGLWSRCGWDERLWLPQADFTLPGATRAERRFVLNNAMISTAGSSHCGL